MPIWSSCCAERCATVVLDPAACLTDRRASAGLRNEIDANEFPDAEGCIAMTDENIEWTGHPSQWQNAWWFLACVLLLPIPYALWLWLVTRNTVYTLTDQRLKFTRGVFNKTTEDLELYRVRDSKFQQNFFERMFGLGEIILYTTDASTPVINLTFIPDAESVREKIRVLVEARRDAKRVRSLDIGGEEPGLH